MLQNAGSIALLLFAAGCPGGQPVHSGFATDAALIQHLRTWDPVFRGALSRCTEEVVDRTNDGRRVRFAYRALCAMNTPPQEASECPYRVHAKGVIAAEWAMIEEWRLTLECAA